MTSEDVRAKLINAPKVLRGRIHKYHTESGYHAYCVIISADHRARDKYVSIISLRNINDQKRITGGEVVLTLPDGSEYFCNCGMITYMRRDRIDEKVCDVSREKMFEIDTAIMDEMGIREVIE